LAFRGGRTSVGSGKTDVRGPSGEKEGDEDYAIIALRRGNRQRTHGDRGEKGG